MASSLGRSASALRQIPRRRAQFPPVSATHLVPAARPVSRRQAPANSSARASPAPSAPRPPWPSRVPRQQRRQARQAESPRSSRQKDASGAELRQSPPTEPTRSPVISLPRSSVLASPPPNPTSP